MTKNVLYYGDNLDILHRYIKDETIDLIYFSRRKMQIEHISDGIVRHPIKILSEGYV